MGLDIVNNEVRINHSHNHWLRTSTAGNPTVTTQNGLEIHSVFKRLRPSRKMKSDKSLPGDGCPIIYAMKGKDDLKISQQTLDDLWRNAELIIPSLITNLGQVDVFVSMPSSHAISRDLGQMLAVFTGKPHIDDMFKKVSIRQANAQLAGLSSPLERDNLKMLQSRLKKMEASAGTDLADFSLKDIPARFRALFSPIIVSPAYAAGVPNYGDVCLVDDLLASGTTLTTAKNLFLSSTTSSLKVSGACLFSDL